ncbi:SpoIVB peptidase [bioreactor metagenome]|uniref:SpoIVB peptidase n=1 Tax=bioreactor metagenome TaxID=1076179 RepID=A0A644X317_9ZZZZ
MKQTRVKPRSLRKPFAALAAAFLLAAIPPAGGAAVSAAGNFSGYEVILGGSAFGVKIYASGVMVVGLSDIETDTGTRSPAYEAGIRVKDVITAACGEQITTVEQLSEILGGSGGQAVNLTVLRREDTFEAVVLPAKPTGQEGYMAGMWVRDSTAGIGTLTFFDPHTGTFGGLGHAICDVDTGEIVPIDKGTVVGATIIDIRKGQKGAAGELVGVFDDSINIGTLFSNGKTGIFGQAVNTYVPSGPHIQVALRGEVKTGPAHIVCSASGSVQWYQIEITKIIPGAVDGKSMCISVTDPKMIELTGGIVQGMSGSPIVQNGKLVGAVTHVMLSDPTKGYGIFIESMLETAEGQCPSALFTAKSFFGKKILPGSPKGWENVL